MIFMTKAGNSPFCFVLLSTGEPPSPATLRGRELSSTSWRKVYQRICGHNLNPTRSAFRPQKSFHFSHMQNTPTPSQGSFPKSTVSAFALNPGPRIGTRSRPEGPPLAPLVPSPLPLAEDLGTTRSSDLTHRTVTGWTRSRVRTLLLKGRMRAERSHSPTLTPSQADAGAFLVPPPA